MGLGKRVAVAARTVGIIRAAALPAAITTTRRGLVKLGLYGGRRSTRIAELIRVCAVTVVHWLGLLDRAAGAGVGVGVGVGGVVGLKCVVTGVPPITAAVTVATSLRRTTTVLVVMLPCVLWLLLLLLCLFLGLLHLAWWCLGRLMRSKRSVLPRGCSTANPTTNNCCTHQRRAWVSQPP